MANYFILFPILVIHCTVTKRKSADNISKINNHTEHFLKDKIFEEHPFIEHKERSETSYSETISKFSKKGKYENTGQCFQGSANLNHNYLPILSKEDIDECFLDTFSHEKNNAFHDKTQPLIFEQKNLPREDFFSSVTQNSSDDVVLDENQKITSESYFLNENTKPTTFDKTNYGPLETFRISKQPLNISQEIFLWSNTEKTLKSFIDKYISDNIPTLYKTNDLRKIKNLEEAFKIFDKNKPTHETNCLLFEHPYKETIICELITICTEFDKNPEFTRNTLDIFLKKYDLKIFYSSYFKNLRNKLARLSDEEKILTFYCEIMKLYKYTMDIPELLTLSGLFSVRSFPSVTLVIHMVGIFIEKNKNVKDTKVLVLCMISKALTCFYGYSFDIFLICNCKFNCIESFHDLNFFVWEFNRNKRKDLKLKIGRNSIWVSSERKYLKSVLMIYLYNHLLYCKYYDVSSESIKLGQEFIEKVMKSEDCIGCLLNEFLRVIQLCSNEKIKEN